MSLYKWGLMGKIQFLEMGNYIRCLRGKYFWEGLTVTAYDDLASIKYFGKTRRAYWSRTGSPSLLL
jgi:hypothetical protein